MIPKRFEPILSALLLTGLMSLIVSGISTLRVAGLTPEFPAQWLTAWLPSWMVAFPSLLLVAPMVRRILPRLVRED